MSSGQRKGKGNGGTGLCGCMGYHDAIQKKLPRAFVYYGQDSVEDGGKRYDGLGVFLPIHKFADRLEKMIGIADEIVMK
mgnify:CR=1 FL=1